MKILVIGGTGNVGVPLVDLLIERRADVRVLTHSADRAALLPAGVESAVANIVEAPADSAGVFEGVDTVFMLNRGGGEELADGLLAVHLAREAGVRRFVYQSVFDAEGLGFLPHVASKLAIEHAIKRSGMEWTFVRPNLFFQNDLADRGDIEGGVYCLPVGSVGCSSVDVRDIAEAAAIALTSEGHDGKTYNIVGPEIVTGADCAAAWSRALGRPVGYVADPASWVSRISRFIPPWLAYDLELMFRHFDRHGFRAGPADVDAVTALLGRAPRRYEAYAREQALISPASRSEAGADQAT